MIKLSPKVKAALIKIDFVKRYEELVSDKTNNFSKIMDFIKELQTNVTEEKISFYFNLLKDERNVRLFLTLRAFFDKYGKQGESFLLNFLSKNDTADTKLISEAIMILSSHNYQCKAVLPYIYKYLTSADEELRYKSIIALGWIGEKNDFSKLKESVKNETSLSNKGYALSAMRQMFFRLPQLKNNILDVYRYEIESADNDEIIFVIGVCVQDLLGKKLYITEDEHGIHSKESADIVKTKVMKILSKEILN
ncbi:MAG: HEAT repeat domain-containing protein [Treponema sp.]|uniref:HEAT repeat domain-containing protein n=1 Tax=Treponema sp. TaxID=166 RepID=UPI0025F24E67|nr:HEAT repeat domain-containing protein [Treponema sp.]MBQ8680608.1 HEAT repeat domain-containing protein [Treponema sp.]